MKQIEQMPTEAAQGNAETKSFYLLEPFITKKKWMPSDIESVPRAKAS